MQDGSVTNIAQAVGDKLYVTVDGQGTPASMNTELPYEVRVQFWAWIQTYSSTALMPFVQVRGSLFLFFFFLVLVRHELASPTTKRNIHVRTDLRFVLTLGFSSNEKHISVFNTAVRWYAPVALMLCQKYCSMGRVTVRTECIA